MCAIGQPGLPSHPARRRRLPRGCASASVATQSDVGRRIRNPNPQSWQFSTLTRRALPHRAHADKIFIGSGSALRGYLYTSRVGIVDPSFRVTDATLDVLQILLDGGDDLYGLKIAKATGRPTGSVFPILARLEDCGWVTSEWESSDPSVRGPRRRFYRLSPDGAELAPALLGRRRAQTGKPRLRPAPVPRPQLQGGQ